MSGFFSKGIIEHGLVKKKISFHSDDEYVMYVEIFMCNVHKVWDYYNKLFLAKVTMPKLFECRMEDNFCTIYQEYIDGISLVEWISNNAIQSNLKYHLIYFDNLLKNQLRSYYLDNRIRIDFNLNNFVVKDNILYLVDVMPPIFIDRVVEAKSKRYNRKIAQLIELYTNINYQIISIIGYWFLDCLSDFSRLTEPYRRESMNDKLMKFIEHGNKYIELYNENISKISKSYIYENADNYFIERVYFLYEYINQKIEFNELVRLFNIRMHPQRN